MALSGKERDEIRTVVDTPADKRKALKAGAEDTLAQLNLLVGQRGLSGRERNAGERAIELLIRLETAENGKGWWYRTKRRLQLARMYLGLRTVA